jgi:hypothetical protein
MLTIADTIKYNRVRSFVWSDMSYTMDIEVQGDCLVAAACGERTGENVSAIAQEILDECLRQGIVKVLLDLRPLTGRLSISESLSVVTHLFPEMSALRKLERVAVIEASERHERSRFFERAAGARGYNIRMFSEQQQAVDWLAQSRQPA